MSDQKRQGKTDPLTGALAKHIKRILLSKPNDAVNLVLQKTEDIDTYRLEKLDLNLVSEIKRTKDGGLEIKFIDRVRLFELALSGAVPDGGGAMQALIQALHKAVPPEEEATRDL